ncbi:MAG: hypothetical protein NZ891_01160, partial [bacterium]|nr:hypothetical protein [bacterium]MDW8163340.1 hypothetical protein [Candidatus Omnitrophota bacterium]
HPTKKEVKIKNDNEIAGEIVKLLEEIFKRGNVRTVEKKYLIEKEFGKEIIKDKTNLFEKKEEELLIPEEKGNTLKEKIKNIRFIGVFKNKYLMFETENGLLMIDQHAAVERINYERFLNEIEENKLQIQQLLTPLIINLNYEEMIVWEKTEKILEKYGFFTTRWSENKIAIHGFPSLIKDIEFSIRSILEEKDIKKFDKNEIIKRACRISVMAGQKITQEEAEYIIKKLIECRNPFVCPHGRPILIEINESFIDRQFLR